MAEEKWRDRPVVADFAAFVLVAEAVDFELRLSHSRPDDCRFLLVCWHLFGLVRQPDPDPLQSTDSGFDLRLA